MRNIYIFKKNQFEKSRFKHRVFIFKYLQKKKKKNEQKNKYKVWGNNKKKMK